MFVYFYIYECKDGLLSTTKVSYKFCPMASLS